MNNKILNVTKVNGRMPVADPFIIGVYHYELYPKSNGKMGVDPSLLGGKTLGNDFDPNAKWRMYHGTSIPGFPHHPHRGFEIVTVVENGYADHFDSQGSKGRYGKGDVQLMSAGSGILHGEMFPLLNDTEENPFQLFQIWVNLPGKDKLTAPQYKMLWNETIPVAKLTSENGGTVSVKVIVGNYGGVQAIEPLPHSWAKDPNHHMGVALVSMEPGTEFKLDAVNPEMKRYVLMYEGNGVATVENQDITNSYFVELVGDQSITIKNGNEATKLLVLEGMPINEPVAAYGPFVMNTEEELHEAFSEYRSTQFGGWPWGSEETDAVNPKEMGRFASYNFGKTIDKPQ